jgi:oxygen-dependent protoporphyrinogen oxidase
LLHNRRNTPVSGPANIAIVGGGIAGLAAAHRVREVAPGSSVRLFEASARLGGALQTVRERELLIEQGADNFITNVPWALDLCRRLGMESELVTTDESRRHVFVVHRGALVKLPSGFLLMAPSRLWPMLTTPLLSPLGKLRMLAEWFLPATTSTAEESLGSFIRRRFGREVFERLVQPLVGGIYAADPELLSVKATMPRFLEMERRDGGLLRGSLKGASSNGPEESGARYGLFVTPRDGMARIIARLTASLPSDRIRLNSAVDRIERTTTRWRVNVVQMSSSQTAPLESLEFDAVILALPAYRASRILESFDVELSKLLNQITYASTSVVTLGYRRRDIGHPLDGFGFVVPAIEKRQIFAGSFSSNKFPGRAPEDQVLIRVFIGGSSQRELADLPDERLRAIAVTELANLLKIQGEPLHAGIARWPRAMPQYHVGHGDLVQQIEQRSARHVGLALAGNAYHGVGVPHCVHSAEQAAERIMASIAH